MNAVALPADLARFADEIVAQGRYRDTADVVRAGVTLLQRAEAERSAFIATLEAAHDEGVRDGFVTVEELAAELDEIIVEAERAQA